MTMRQIQQRMVGFDVRSSSHQHPSPLTVEEEAPPAGQTALSGSKWKWEW